MIIAENVPPYTIQSSAINEYVINHVYIIPCLKCPQNHLNHVNVIYALVNSFRILNFNSTTVAFDLKEVKYIVFDDSIIDA